MSAGGGAFDYLLNCFTTSVCLYFLSGIGIKCYLIAESRNKIRFICAKFEGDTVVLRYCS